MGFGGLVPSSVINLITNQQRGQVRPMGDNITPDGEDPSTPAQPERIIPTFTRGNDIQGQDSGDTDSTSTTPQKFVPPVIPPASNVSGFNFTPDSMGVPTSIPSQSSRPTGLDNPAIPQTPNNRLNNGTPMPTRQDDKYAQMGRGGSARAAFTQGFQHGDIVGGALNALFGAIDKDYGRQIAYNQDSQRWFNTKDAQLKTEEMDPVLRSRIAVGTREAELPGDLEKYTQEQKINYGLRGDYLKQQGQQRLNEIAARGLNQKTAIETRQALKNTGDLDGLTALYTGMIDPDTGQKFTADEAAQQAKADILDQKTAKTEKLWSQQNLADKRAEEIDAITKNLPQKFADAHTNVELANRRVAVMEGNAAQRDEHDRLAFQTKALDTELRALEVKHKALGSYLYSLQSDTSPDALAKKNDALKRMQPINDRMDVINNQLKDISGAPQGTAPGTPMTPRRSMPGQNAQPSNTTTYQKDQIITKKDGSRVRVVGMSPNGKPMVIPEP